MKHMNIPRTQSLQTIALIGVREGVIQLGAVHKVPHRLWALPLVSIRRLCSNLQVEVRQHLNTIVDWKSASDKSWYEHVFVVARA